MSLDYSRFDALTFDCYGTLIDWETGLAEAFRPVLAAHGIDADDEDVIRRYARYEAAAEAGDVPALSRRARGRAARGGGRARVRAVRRRGRARSPARSPTGRRSRTPRSRLHGSRSASGSA